MILVLKLKYGDFPVYARDDAERDRAYLLLFNLMKEHGCYNYDLDGDQIVWYEEAVQGNALSARWLLDVRSTHGYEYETIEEICPVTP